MVDFLPGLLHHFGHGLPGPLKLVIFGKIFLRIFLGSEPGIQGDANPLIGVIVQAF